MLERELWDIVAGTIEVYRGLERAVLTKGAAAYSSRNCISRRLGRAVLKRKLRYIGAGSNKSRRLRRAVLKRERESCGI